MAKIRVQICPEIEFKMEIEVDDVDTDTRDYEVQQQKKVVVEEFNRRLAEAFPEGYHMHTFEFGLDRGWHDELGDEPGMHRNLRGPQHKP